MTTERKGYSSIRAIRMALTTTRTTTDFLSRHRNRSFIQNLHENAKDKRVANSVIALGHCLIMSVLAEGAPATAVDRTEL